MIHFAKIERDPLTDKFTAYASSDIKKIVADTEEEVARRFEAELKPEDEVLWMHPAQAYEVSR